MSATVPIVNKCYASRLLVLLSILLSPAYIGSQAQSRSPVLQSDPLLKELLANVVHAAGGASATGVQDLLETGEATFYWDRETKGQATIHSRGGTRFRLDIDLPDGRTTWVVKNAAGWKNKGTKETPLPYENSINLGNLTFPVAHLCAALNEPTTEASVKLEDQSGHPVYRVRLNGTLNLTQNRTVTPVRKEFLLDAMTFDILGVRDYPMSAALVNGVVRRPPRSSASGDNNNEEPVDEPPRTIEYKDFRTVNGVRIPFLIAVKLHGQPAYSLTINGVQLNTHFDEAVFDK